MTIRVSSGSCWPSVSNCSTTSGTTKIISAMTTMTANARDARWDRPGPPASWTRIAACRSSRLDQPLGQRRQAARALARRDHRAIEAGKAARLAAMASARLRPSTTPAWTRAGDVADMRLLALARDRAQRLLERRDLGQRRELAREQRQLLGGEPVALEAEHAAGALAACSARRCTAPPLADAHDEQLLRGQRSRAPRRRCRRAPARGVPCRRRRSPHSRSQASTASASRREIRIASSALVSPRTHQRARR